MFRSTSYRSCCGRRLASGLHVLDIATGTGLAAAAALAAVGPKGSVFAADVSAAMVEPARLRSLFETAGFEDVKTTTESHRFTLPTFDAYFGPFERGGGSTGQVYVTLPEAVCAAVRDELRGSLNDSGGPVEIEVEFLFA